jgi:hypothetical protein
LTRTRSKTPLLLILASLSGPLAAASSEAGQLEVLIGHYHCSVGTESGIAYMWFEGSGDVLLKETYFYDPDFSPSGPPAEACGQEAAEIHEVVASAACTASSISSESYDDGGFASNFDFVCRGNRNRVISDLAGIVGQILGVAAH